MPLRFAFTRPDGGVSIVNAMPKEGIEVLLGPLTEDEYEAHVLERSIPADAVKVTRLPDDWTPPSDRTFRNAWAHRGGGKIDVDMPKARGIHKARLRELREPVFKQNDVDFIIAQRTGDKDMEHRANDRRQALRDVTVHPAIEAAKTPEELAAAVPPVLLG